MDDIDSFHCSCIFTFFDFLMVTRWTPGTCFIPSFCVALRLLRSDRLCLLRPVVPTFAKGHSHTLHKKYYPRLRRRLHSTRSRRRHRPHPGHRRTSVHETREHQQIGHLHKPLFFGWIHDFLLHHLRIRHSVRSCGETKQSVTIKPTRRQDDGK